MDQQLFQLVSDPADGAQNDAADPLIWWVHHTLPLAPNTKWLRQCCI